MKSDNIDVEALVDQFLDKLILELRDRKFVPENNRWAVAEIAESKLREALAGFTVLRKHGVASAFAQGALDAQSPNRGMVSPFMASGDGGSSTFARNVTGDLRQDPPIIDAEVIDEEE